MERISRRILDVGCGSDPERWFPGADLCEINFDSDEPHEVGARVFNDMCSSSSPLPVPDGSYDLIWYSYGWQWVAPESYDDVAKEMSRVAAPKATIIIKDYCSVYNWDTDEEVEMTAYEWRDNLMRHFTPFGWTLASIYREIDTEDMLCVLSRNWG